MAPEVEPAQPVTVHTERKAWPRWILAAGVIAGLVGGYLVANRPQARSGGQTLQLSIFPPNGYALEAGSSRQTFALSPDGARLAFTAMDASGAFQTFIRDLDAHESRPLANSNYSYTVFWAPDGRSLFQTVRGSLRRTALAGDSYQVLCDTPPIMLMGALLAPNLLISGRSTNFIVPLSGGTPHSVKELYQWPQVLPDGKHVLYTVFDSKLGRHRARVPRQRIEAVASVHKLLSLVDGRLFVDTGDANMNRALAGPLRVRTGANRSMVMRVTY